MTFAWNIVANNIERDESIEKKIRQKIAKLEKHLKHFPPDAVHLQIVLERHPTKPLYTVDLNLRVPSNIFHSTQSAEDVITAFDKAFKTLLPELENFKSTMRVEHLWKRKARREELHLRKSACFAEQHQSEDCGPQKREDVIRELFLYHYRDLLRHTRRHIRHDELAGDIPAGRLDAREIVDEVSRRAMARHAERPSGMGYLIWFYHLIHEELERRRALLKEKQATKVPAEKSVKLPELSEEHLQPLEEIVQKEMEPQVIRAEGIVPNSEAVGPDEFLLEKDALEQLQHDMKKWPRPEREVFELYYVEGLEPEEIALATSQPIKQVEETLNALRERLRQTVLEAAATAGPHP